MTANDQPDGDTEKPIRFVWEGRLGSKTYGKDPLGHYFRTGEFTGNKYLFVVNPGTLGLYAPGKYEVNEITGWLTAYIDGPTHVEPLTFFGKRRMEKLIRKYENGKRRKAAREEAARQFVESQGGAVSR